jgi:hypothetical protein
LSKIALLGNFLICLQKPKNENKRYPKNIVMLVQFILKGMELKKIKIKEPQKKNPRKNFFLSVNPRGGGETKTF